MEFIDEIAATPGGEKIRDCIQCGVCTGTCPMASEMAYPPRKVIAMIRAGLREEVLSSSSMWHCLSCYLCYERCPKGVHPTEIAHSLESLAVKHGYPVKGTRNPAMYRSFVASIKSQGRVQELNMMLRYYLATNPLAAIKALPVALKLLRHKRLPLRAEKVQGKTDLTKIRRKFREVRGQS